MLDLPDATDESQTVLYEFTCDICQRGFNSRSNYIDHLSQSHAEQVDSEILYCCSQCDECFETSKGLSTHKSSSCPSKLLKLECALCDYAASQKEIVEHYWDSHAHNMDRVRTVHTCPCCEHSTTSIHSVYRHLSHNHGLDSVFTKTEEDVCPVCAAQLANPDGVLQHMAVKHQDIGQKLYECRECDSIHQTQGEVTTHIRKSHNLENETEIKYSCQNCQYSSTSRSATLSHIGHKHLTTVYSCLKCKHQCAQHQSAVAHMWAEHSEYPVSVDKHDVVDQDTTLECLYSINKHAKKYANLGTENYRKGKKTTAKANSVKKSALYELKTNVLKQIEHSAEIKLHVINNSDFYLFEFDNWSFHVPRDEIFLPERERQLTDETVLDGFEKEAEKERTNKSLKECLLYFKNEFRLNANEFLSQTHLSYGRKSHFIGWTYL